MPLVTPAQAAEILNIGVVTVYTLASTGAITRHAPFYARGQTYDLDELEQRSLSSLRRTDLRGHPCWATVHEAADYLGVGASRVRPMLGDEKITSVTAPAGRRYVRRHQLEVIAKASEQRAGLFH